MYLNNQIVILCNLYFYYFVEFVEFCIDDVVYMEKNDC